MTVQAATGILLWVGAIGCGVIGGLYFAFSTFIMQALGRIDPGHGIAAMNAINATILRSLFMPLFWGTTVACVLLAVLAVATWSGTLSVLMLAGGAIFVVGMFVVTVAFNVPLNTALAHADGAKLNVVWGQYLVTWTAWNHVRTLASIGTAILFVIAIAQRAAD